MRSLDKLYMSNTFNKYGVLFTNSLEPLSDKNNAILIRFGKVLEQSYTSGNLQLLVVIRGLMHQEMVQTHQFLHLQVILKEPHIIVLSLMLQIVVADKLKVLLLLQISIRILALRLNQCLY